jgi:TRAP-type mannitol/chloroaromatic compound transport system permease large subunit
LRRLRRDLRILHRHRATMSKVAYPSMRKLGYSDSLSTGVIAASGTLGIMIPRSPPSW